MVNGWRAASPLLLPGDQVNTIAVPYVAEHEFKTENVPPLKPTMESDLYRVLCVHLKQWQETSGAAGTGIVDVGVLEMAYL
jgi:hypothetical protein